MEVYVNTLEEATIGGFTHQAIITYADLQALAAGATGATAAFTIGIAAGSVGLPEVPGTTVPKAAFVGRVAVYVEVPFTFSDGTLLNAPVTVTDGTNTLSASQETISGSAVTIKVTNNAQIYTAQTNILAEFTPTASKNLNTCTAGELHIRYELVNIASDLVY